MKRLVACMFVIAIALVTGGCGEGETEGEALAKAKLMCAPAQVTRVEFNSEGRVEIAECSNEGIIGGEEFEGEFEEE